MADAVLKDLLFRSHVALQIAMTCMDTVHAARSGPADVSHHLGERAGTDIVEVAEDVDVLWRAAMRSNQSRVVLQRCFIIADADVASVVELRDINVVFVLVGVDDPIGRKASAARTYPWACSFMTCLAGDLGGRRAGRATSASDRP